MVETRFFRYWQQKESIPLTEYFRFVSRPLEIKHRPCSTDLLITMCILGSAFPGRGSLELPQNSASELHLLPATGYRFQVRSGPLADFVFDVNVDGQTPP